MIGFGIFFRFNRDIVECKDGSLSCSFVQYQRFNRDIVECKAFQSLDVYAGFKLVLIET